MKRAILVFVLSSGAMFAQVHGTSSSVTSFTGGHHGVHGVPSSVTSLGPRGYSVQGPCLGVQGCTNPAFNSRIDFRSGTVVQGQTFNLRGGHHRGRNTQGGGVIYYPYAYPVPVAVVPEDQYAEDPQQQQPDPPGLTVFDRRSNVQRAPNPTPYAPPEPRMEASATVPQANPVRELEPVVIVFKDGHQQEIGNYAIVGDTIYDMNNYVSHKIKLADVDLQQTIQKNEDRGVEFAVPANLKPKA